MSKPFRTPRSLGEFSCRTFSWRWPHACRPLGTSSFWYCDDGYGAGRRPYLIYAQSDFLPGRDF